MKSDLSYLLRKPVSWLAPASPEDDIIISSRIRLARNLNNMPFPVSGEKTCLQNVCRLCLEALNRTEAIADPMEIDYRTLDSLERQLLLERRLISREFVKDSIEPAFIAEKDESVSIMINEEDHLRIQAFSPGLNLPELWDKVNRIDDSLSGELDFAFDKKFGYLTASPSNLGTGMCASVMLHLPAMTLAGKMNSVIQGISKLGMSVRGFYGKSTLYTGSLYQISNQSTLGESEEQILFRLNGLVRQVIRHEKEARSYFLSQKRDFILDHVGRAYGMLRYCYQISSKEALDSLSALRLGVDLGMFSSVDINAVNHLFLLVQPAHLIYHAGRELEKDGRNSERAKIIREMLKDLREQL